MLIFVQKMLKRKVKGGEVGTFLFSLIKLSRMLLDSR